MNLVNVAARLIAFGILAASVGWVMFFVVVDMHGGGMTGPGSRPVIVVPIATGQGSDSRRRLGLLQTPAPDVLPAKPPPYREHLAGYNLRKCRCRLDWKDNPTDSPVCKCQGEGVCGPEVNPPFLTAAEGQSLCSLTADTGYNCYAECAGSGEVKWYATPCGGTGMQPCDERQAAPPSATPTPPPEASKIPKLTWNPSDVYDLRGLKCEELNGKEQCFYEDAQGRELCPPHVTSEWLAFTKDQYLCTPEMADKYYCTVGCQEGNPDVRWGANEVAWCYDPKNFGACPPRPSVIPKSEWKLKPWSEKPEPIRRCREDYKQGKRGAMVEDVTFGMLTHEPRSMHDSLETYERMGLFDVAAEFLVYINKRRPEIDEVLKPYLKKYSPRFKVLGDPINYGIARGITFLTGNATRPYFLFLERDFQLVEPSTCVEEEIRTGVDLIKRDVAQVVRYRHRKKAGRPNWAERMFRGKEDEVFKRGQPNLFCNHHYWVPDGEKRWPDKMWVCDPQHYDNFFCTDSYYCNWTNNPQLWEVKWWDREYVSRFDKWTRHNPWEDLEVYMNWEPNSWNDRKFIVAQGDGLFKHVDRGNFGTF